MTTKTTPQLPGLSTTTTERSCCGCGLYFARPEATRGWCGEHEKQTPPDGICTSFTPRAGGPYDDEQEAAP